MDSMERSHAFESAVVSALFDTRQFIWTEFSTVISNIKEQLERSNKERNTDIHRLIDENKSLTDLLTHVREIVEGKEMEILGLRRQLQSFYVGHPICSMCLKEVDTETMQQNVYLEDRKRPHSNTSSCASSDAAVVPKDLSRPLPARWRLTNEHKPTQKRRCMRSSLEPTVKPMVLLRDAASQDLCGSEDVMQSAQVVCDHACSPSKPALYGLGELSPPTDRYDASLAIHKAVNHLDLPADELTQMEARQTPSPQLADTTDDQSSITLSVEDRRLSKFVFRRPGKSRAQLIASQRLHRRLGLGSKYGIRRQLRRKGAKSARSIDPDDTGADLSLLSDLAGRTENSKPSNRTSSNQLPSIGGSPTAPSEQIFKRPKVPAAHAV